MFRRVLVVLATVAVLSVSGGAVAAQPTVKKPQAVDRTTQQRIKAAFAEANRSPRIYIVQMREKPTVAYQGDISGFAKTAPEKGARFDARSAPAQAYAARLVEKQDALLRSVGAADRKVYSYTHALNGFAARLTRAQAGQFKKHPDVLNVWEDRAVPLDTNNSPRFLGLLDERHGLRTARGLRGKGIKIGVIDSGAVQEHPSFDDRGYKPPEDWNGTCQAGEGWDAEDCNNKLIGARYYIAGLGEENAVPGEFISPRDSDGHGTHTATTAAGREVRASLNGTPLAKISGIAPDAYIAVYKACWEAVDPDLTGCYFSDTAAATDDAVQDGVDIITYSIGTAFSFVDPTDVAFLFAADAGVFVSRSAGNEGPDPETTASGEPWVTTVAASTQSGKAYSQATVVNSPAEVAGNYASDEGAITQPLSESGPVTGDLAAADPIDACEPIAPIAGVALIARGTCDFVVKIANAVDAGATAVLMYSDDRPRTVMGGDATPVTQSIPGVMVDQEPGLALLAQLEAEAVVNVTLTNTVYVQEQMTGNVMADFSARGPYPNVPSWIKPDVTAPGVRILAGETPEPNTGLGGDFYQYLNGTSMSTPHVAGTAALLLERHKFWSPAQVKSALMTTARQNVKKEDGTTKADPFDYGAGHIQPNLAIKPGLAYDVDLNDYLAATCGTESPLISPELCGQFANSGRSVDPDNLNLPSIGIGNLFGKKTIYRTLTNVGTAGQYTANVQPPPGFRVTVEPSEFNMPVGKSRRVRITIANKGTAPQGEWAFGAITFEGDNGRSVRTPLAVRATLLDAPDGFAGAGADGSESFDVTFGYTGEYTAGVHGLLDPDLIGVITVADDPDNTFDQTFGDDEVVVGPFPTEAGTAYAQWSMYDEYTDGSHDMDLYLIYCPSDVNLPCTFDDVSFSATSTERVGAVFPKDDGTEDDGYFLVIHGYETENQEDANLVLFTWAQPGASEDLGNMTVTAPASAVVGETGTVEATWTGLATGPGAKQVGAISHTGEAGPISVTTVEITNDEGSGFCDLVAC
jgi:subtilisin family serine protease